MGHGDQIAVPAGVCDASVRVQASRFIAHIGPAQVADEAEELLAGLRKRYHDATHHCWAYRVGLPGELVEHSSDAGEPSGTAGRPILDELCRVEVVNAVCVVVRYYGGTKLGTGGLKRAYGDAARAVCEACPRATQTIARELRISFPHDSTGRVYHVIAAHGGRIVGNDYGDTPQLTVRVARSKAQGLTDAVREAGQGRIMVVEGDVVLMG